MTTLEPVSQTFKVEMPITIRQAEKADLAQLEMDGLFERFRLLFQRAYREQKLGNRIMLVADCNGSVIGRLFILLKSTDTSIADGTKRAYLYSFFVLSPFRGRSVGTRMVKQAEALLLERNFRIATIAVAKENEAALRLYERLNYVRIRQDPGKWSYTDHKGVTHDVVEPCWILEKKLKMV